MADPAVRLAGAVLVGGHSRRMGRDKAMLEVDGHPMAERVARALEAAGVSDVVFVGGDARPLGRRHLADRYPGQGPLGGLLTALGGLEADLVVVAACDLPWLDAATIEALLSGLGTADVAVARTDRLEPLCGMWRRSTTLEVVESAFAGGERAIHRALAGLRVVEVPVAPRALTNVNAPEDLLETDERDSAG